MNSMLSTFVAPRPNTALIRMLEPVNRLFNLRGVPVLRDLPLIGRIPGLRGLMNIREIDFPSADVARLRAVVNRDTAVFIAPNHPEFFTDWMIDKEVMSRLDVTPGCWATHKVVNGMGRWGQRFWLANNLIAQIPGAGGVAGKDHSIALAKKGDGVLLHPEGAVHWVADQIGPLFPGVLDMAARTAGELAGAGVDRPVYIAPLIYKYMFIADETANLHRALSYLEEALDLVSGEGEDNPAVRLRAVYLQRAERIAQRHGVSRPQGAFWAGQTALITALTARLGAFAEGGTVEDDDPYARAERVLKAYDRARRCGAEAVEDARPIADDLRELLGLQPWMYPGGTMTQEQIAERIQRLRLDTLKTRLRDRVHAFIPQPVGPRRAYIRLVKPLRIETGSEGISVNSLRETMQARLDRLNADLAGAQSGPVRPNPFTG